MNYPNNNTIISQYHKIYYKGEFIEAYKFVKNFKYVTKIKYNQEILYNILLEKYTTIIANNLVCETLHPKNVIAKLYSNNLNDEEKKKTICEIVHPKNVITKLYENKLNDIENTKTNYALNNSIKHLKNIKRLKH